KRFFGEGNAGRYIFLVDEAHNLVERARMMYSESMIKEDILAQKKIFKDRSERMVKALEKANKTMLAMKRDCDKLTVLEDIYELSFALDRLQSEYERLLAKEHHLESREEVLEFFFKLRNFNAIYQLTDKNYIFYKNIREDGSFEVTLYCANPAENLQHRIDMSVATCMYSATLLPVNYYKTLLSTNPDNYAVYAKSIFKPSQRLLLIGRDVSSLYKRRNASEFEKFADYILKITSAKKGNYIVFFPSYKMLESISEVLYEKAGLAPGYTFLEQGMSMSEQERSDFLSEFEQKRDDTLVGLCVMGGIFGEGVDLTGEKLIGTIIIGTGMPLPSDELKLLQSFFDEHELNGFDYVYRYPGMNKVLQAAGRVIRTVDDRGVIALLDERFLYRENTALFPVEWEERSVCTLDSVEKELTEFWKK
ncbi:MAG: ATP-dependent DNA helicase, partial [Lachnospiraceae bacterium]|nr:ATP-dependent DNA helicase [Lachnospiraceae bacterium]